MYKFNVYDVCEIQESLDAYLRLIQWMPALTAEEQAMRDARVEHVEFLINKCERIIEQSKANGETNE